VALKRPGNLEALRRELSRLTDLGVEEHERQIEGVRIARPHEVELVERADPAHEFACVMYALGLANTIAGKLSIIDIPPAAIVRPEMLDFMRATGRLTEIDRREATQGAVVIYYRGNETKHVGLVDGDKIRSKWGIGHVWRHPAFEVPDSYGDLIRYFEPVKRPAALGAYRAYVSRKYGKNTVARARRQLDR
jgi:hypothetical protein